MVASAAGPPSRASSGSSTRWRSAAAAVAVSEVPWAERKRLAITRGLDFLQTLGEQLFRNRQLSTKHGADLLLPFYVPPARAPGSDVERHALRVATRLASEWRARVRESSRHLPPRVAPSELLDLMQGAYSLECLGMAEPLLHAQLLERSAAYGSVDFFKFDPTAGPPPDGLREDCACGAKVGAHASECGVCKRAAVPMSQFDVYLEALVWSFHGCRMRIGLGACFYDVLRQVCAAFGRLYPRRGSLGEKDRHYLTYALTHVIYALNNFDERSLPPSLFPPTVPSYLQEQLRAAIRADDPDLTGEILDCLKCLGEGGSAAVTEGERFLVSRQSSADGGWVCKGEADLYSRYHASLVAVAALMEHSYAAHGPVFERAAEVLPHWFASVPSDEAPTHQTASGADPPSDGLPPPLPPPPPPRPTCLVCGCARGARCCTALCPSLCDVDHGHELARAKRAEACVQAARELVPQWPLPATHREVVALLPVMRRLVVREAVQADKLRQHQHHIRQQARARDHRRYIDRDGRHSDCISSGGLRLRSLAGSATAPPSLETAALSTTIERSRARGAAWACVPQRSHEAQAVAHLPVLPPARRTRMVGMLPQMS